LRAGPINAAVAARGSRSDEGRSKKEVEKKDRRRTEGANAKDEKEDMMVVIILFD